MAAGKTGLRTAINDRIAHRIAGLHHFAGRLAGNPVSGTLVAIAVTPFGQQACSPAP
jgi:hypothetical protein